MPFEDAAMPVIGFFTTRQVRADSAEEAELAALECIRADWRAGGCFAEANRGDMPTLVVEALWEVGRMTAWFKRSPRGYSFYLSTND
jgi:hypothetical protein